MEMPEEKAARERKEYSGADNIDELKERMYSRENTGYLPWRERHAIPQERSLVKESWEYIPPKPRRFERFLGPYSGASAALVFSVIFFIVALVLGLQYLNRGVTAKGGVDIVIEGPTSIASGDVLELQVLVTNRNAVPLALADLIVEYPSGAVSPADFKTQLTSERIPLGVIDARSARRGAVRAVMLDKREAQTAIKVSLQYRLGDGNAIYTDSTSHLVSYTSEAMSLSVVAQKEAVPGQEATFAVTMKSQATTILNNVILKARYPFGFTVNTTSPQAETTNEAESQWAIGSLRPGEERTVYVVGVLNGQAGDARTIIFETGTAKDTTATTTAFAQVLARNDYQIVVKRPFLETTLTFNKSAPDAVVAEAGEELEGVLAWRNTLAVPITDATLAITIGGLALDKTGVNAGQDGFYRSVDSLLIWDAQTTKDKLATVAPGASGEFTFRIKPLPVDYLAQVRKPTLTFAVHAAGERLGETGVPEVLRDTAQYTVKVGTNTTFAAFGLLPSSPFGARGPQPPKVEYETTYAIVWELSNTTSDLDGVMVEATLPHYVRWVGLSNPTSEQITYNKTDNTVTWNTGSVKAGTGSLGTSARRVVFAVGLVPSATQISTSPILVYNQQMRAKDAYTGASIVIDAEPITTNLQTGDPLFDLSHARVVE